jgi:hypothetical protein
MMPRIWRGVIEESTQQSNNRNNAMRRLIIGLICAVALSSASNQQANAGVIPDVYNFVFGPPGTPYFRSSYYGPAYGYGANYQPAPYYRVRSYYSPTPYYRVRSYYSPACSTCQPCGIAYPPCSPCAVGCSPCGITGSCPSGNCAVSSRTPVPADDNWRPTPADDGPPPTYKEGDGFGASGQSEDPDADGGRESESLKPATDVPQRNGAPVKDPEADDANDKEAGEEAQPAKTDEVVFPPLNVDDKITWRARPIRKRLTIRSRFPTPSIARNRVNPNDKWVSVPTETKIVSK